MSFKEYLKDYEEREKEFYVKYRKTAEDIILKKRDLTDIQKFIKTRFKKLEEPLGRVSDCPIWCTIPFYGSTIIPLIPRNNKQDFDKLYSSLLGFDSTNIDQLLSLAEIGKVQFILVDNPTLYRNLDFLEPLLRCLEPPLIVPIQDEILIGNDQLKKHTTEFDTLANFGFKSILNSIYSGRVDSQYINHEIYSDAVDYAILKFLGYYELIDALEKLMIDDPLEAIKVLSSASNLILGPMFDILKPIYNRNLETLKYERKMISEYSNKTSICETNIQINEIGKLILTKLVHYPEMYDSCLYLINVYDDNDLYKLLKAIENGIRSNNIDIITSNVNELSQVIDNIWKDSKSIGIRENIIRYGISISMAIIGELATNFSGSGILSTLGFNCVDRIIGIHEQSFSKHLTNFFSPNHLITIYDFKHKYNIQ